MKPTPWPQALALSKAEEIETLRQTAINLGPCSYCGPWLLDQLESIAADLRSDLTPQTYESSQRIARDRISAAEEHAAALLSLTRKQAEKIKAEAYRQADGIRSSTLKALRLAVDSLDR
jgi:hypothetical protein